MRALVTGGGGFIGSNLVDALLTSGHDVVVLDDFSTGRRANLDGAGPAGAVVHELDLRDGAAVAEVVARERPELVFHLAAQVDVRRSVTHTAHDVRVNVEGTVNVLEAARRGGVRRVVYSSTGGAIYGEGAALPAPEDTAVRPLAPYGQAKFAGEGYCALYGRLHGLSTISLRYANVYGPRQDPLGEAGVVAIFCGRLAAGGAPTVYGDGRQTRDYVYVGDVVRANLLAAESEATGELNVGTGIQTSVLELVEVLRGLCPDVAFQPRHEPARAGEVRRSALDATRARAVLGWAPEVELSAGLRETLGTVAS